MRKLLLTALLIVAVGVVGTYVYFQGKEYTFRLTEAELQEKLADRLPLRKTYLFIFEVVLDDPRLALIEGSDRVNAGLDVTLNIKINDEPLPFGGELDVSGGVRYDAREGQFFLTDPVIENLSVQGVPANYTDGVNSVVTTAIGELFSDRPIYTLKGSDVKTATAKLLLKNVVIEERVLIVTLGL
jgi:hypothetical protein